EYHKQFNPLQQERLQQVYQTISAVFIKQDITWQEKISYQIPTFYYKQNVIHYAAYKNHIGIYPGAKAIEYVLDDVNTLGLKHSKGCIQINNKNDIPHSLIAKIVEYRLGEIKKVIENN
ncbi:MAG: iron chaperone, partial [Bacilli bacterium]